MNLVVMAGIGSPFLGPATSRFRIRVSVRGRVRVTVTVRDHGSSGL